MNIITGNVIEEIKKMEDLSFNTIFSDVPYQMGSEIIFEGYRPVYKKSVDFKNSWEGLSAEDWEFFFKESFRVLKYGGYCLIYGVDRQLMLFSYYAHLAGFEQCQSVYWYVMNGLIRSSKIEIEENETLQKTFGGYRISKTPFKSTVETVLVFRKPFLNDSAVGDILEWFEGDDTISPAALNIDGSKIKIPNQPENSESGRQPTNLFLNEDAANELDKQSDFKKGTGLKANPKYETTGLFGKRKQGDMYDDLGGCSKILRICDYEAGEFYLLHYVKKTSKKEKNFGLSVSNEHPTGKPIELNYRIFQLFKLPEECGQKVLIPFSGVGSEIIGVLKNGIAEENVLAIEINPDYVEIANKRIDFWKVNDLKFENKTTKPSIKKDAKIF